MEREEFTDDMKIEFEPNKMRVSFLFLFSFLSILSRSNFDHHLRCGGWLNFEFS